jgi:hypothetical protein
MHRGSGVAVRITYGDQAGQVFAADLISVAGRSTWAAPNTYRGSMFSYTPGREQWLPQMPRPRNTSVPLSRSSHVGGLCPKTLLVSFRLGEGAAPKRLMTSHQEDERESASNHGLWLRALCPATLLQSMLYIRKESAVGFALREPVRQRARALPSAVTQKRSV